MRYGRAVRFAALLLSLVVLLEACGPESGGGSISTSNTSANSTGGPENQVVAPNSSSTSGLNTAPNSPATNSIPGSATTAGPVCKDVKSRELSPGLNFGKYICLEGTITDIQVDSNTKIARMNLDTTTGNSGGSLYSVEIYISDVFDYGVEKLDGFFNGVPVRVKGTFAQGGIQSGYIAQYLIKVSRPDEIEIIL